MAVPSDTAAGERKRKQCDLCGTESAKYKCPYCPVEFCSPRCFQPHRDKHNTSLSQGRKVTLPQSNVAKALQSGIAVLSGPLPPVGKPTMACVVCGQDRAMYKCSLCPKAYCSMSCYVAHQQKHARDGLGGLPVAAPQEPAPKKRKMDQLHPFSVLDNAPELRQLFARHPNLAAKLDAIYETTLPPKDQPTAPAAAGGSSLPWKVPATDLRGRKKDDKQPWTQDVGLQRGQKALRDARADPGDDGRAVREFCELVIQLLSKNSDDEEGRPAATIFVESQMLERNFSMIKNMLEGEDLVVQR